MNIRRLGYAVSAAVLVKIHQPPTKSISQLEAGDYLDCRGKPVVIDFVEHLKLGNNRVKTRFSISPNNNAPNCLGEFEVQTLNDVIEEVNVNGIALGQINEPNDIRDGLNCKVDVASGQIKNIDDEINEIKKNQEITKSEIDNIKIMLTSKCELFESMVITVTICLIVLFVILSF